MSRLLNKWSLSIEYEGKLSVEFRYFSRERAARRAFREDYEENTEVRGVHLYAPIDQNRELEKLK